MAPHCVAAPPWRGLGYPQIFFPSFSKESVYYMDIRQLLLDMVPFNRFIGIEIGDISADGVTITLPLRPEIANHLGSIHAAAQFALGESACAAQALLPFADQIDRVIPLNRRSSIDYFHASEGALTARGTLAAAEQERIRADFAAAGKARFTTVAHLTDSTSTPVTTVTVEFVIVSRPAS